MPILSVLFWIVTFKEKMYRWAIWTLDSFEDYFAEVLKDIFEIMQERHIALYKKAKYLENILRIVRRCRTT